MQVDVITLAFKLIIARLEGNAVIDKGRKALYDESVKWLLIVPKDDSANMARVKIDDSGVIVVQRLHAAHTIWSDVGLAHVGDPDMADQVAEIILRRL